MRTRDGGGIVGLARKLVMFSPYWKEAKRSQSVHELVDDPKMGCKSVWLFFCREGRLSECKQASKRERVNFAKQSK